MQRRLEEQTYLDLSLAGNLASAQIRKRQLDISVPLSQTLEKDAGSKRMVMYIDEEVCKTITNNDKPVLIISSKDLYQNAEIAEEKRKAAKKAAEKAMIAKEETKEAAAQEEASAAKRDKMITECPSLRQ